MDLYPTSSPPKSRLRETAVLTTRETKSHRAVGQGYLPREVLAWLSRRDCGPSPRFGASQGTNQRRFRSSQSRSANVARSSSSLYATTQSRSEALPIGSAMHSAHHAMLCAPPGSVSRQRNPIHFAEHGVHLYQEDARSRSGANASSLSRQRPTVASACTSSCTRP